MKYFNYFSALIILTSCVANRGSELTFNDAITAKSSSPASLIFTPAPKNKEEALTREAKAANTPINQWIPVKDPYYSLKYPFNADISMYDTWTPSMVTGNIPELSAHCQNLGASHPDIIEDKTQGIRSVQGYVDYFDTMDTPVGNPDPPCRPPGGKDSAAYVFCSEKSGKQVVICISQQTANLALAEDIFKTFRWTDQ